MRTVFAHSRTDGNGHTDRRTNTTKRYSPKTIRNGWGLKNSQLKNAKLFFGFGLYQTTYRLATSISIRNYQVTYRLAID